MRSKIAVLAIWLFSQFLQASCEDEETTRLRIKHYTPIFTYLYIFILISIAFRIFTLEIWNIIPYGVWLLSVGVIVGIISIHVKDTFRYLYLDIDPALLRMLNLTTVVFRMSLLVDVHIFIKSIPQILTICGPGFLLTTCMVAVTMSKIADLNTFDQYMVLGVSCAVTMPLPVIKELISYGSKTKHLVVLLQGETLIGNGVYIIIIHLIKLHSGGVVSQWYQILFLAMRYVGIGCLVGYAFGNMGCFLMLHLAHETRYSIMVYMTIPYVAYYVTSELLAASGVLCVIIVGIMMNSRRASLKKELDESIVLCWELCFFVVNSFVYLRISVFVVASEVTSIDLSDVLRGTTAYLVENLCRFCSFLLVGPILRRIGYGLSFKDMLVCVWGGLKSPMGIFMVYDYVSVELEQGVSTPKLLNVVSALYSFFYISLLVNGSLIHTVLWLLGFSNVSIYNQQNMTYCIRYLMQRREREISKLKMEQYMTDLNWDILRQATALKHPYKHKAVAGQEEAEDEDEEEDLFIGYRFTTCPDCNTEVVGKPTRKELKVMHREASRRILKLQQISYLRQYQLGVLSLQPFQNLNAALESTIHSDDPHIRYQSLFEGVKLSSYNELELHDLLDDWFSQIERGGSETLMYQSKIDEAKRKTFKSIVFNKFFVIITLLSIILYVCMGMFCLTVVLYHMSFLTAPPRWWYILFTIHSTLVTVFFITEYGLKVVALGWRYFKNRGCFIFFSSADQRMELLLLIIALTDLVLTYWWLFQPLETITAETLPLFLIIRLAHLCRIRRVFNILSLHYSRLSREGNTHENWNVTVSYEIAKAFVIAQDEILKVIDVIIQNEQIRNEMRAKIMQERKIVNHLLGIFQKFRPWIAVTIKTVHATRIVLNNMRDTINNMRVRIALSPIDQKHLLHMLQEREFKVASSLNFVQPISAAKLFEQVTWLGNDETFIMELFESATHRYFNTGDVVCQRGEYTAGIYVLISGLLLLTYEPNLPTLTRLNTGGILPVVDYLHGNTFEDSFTEFIFPGNSIGELATLTGRRYDSKVTAEAFCEVLLLKTSLIGDLIQIEENQTNGLVNRIWRAIALRLAVSYIQANNTTKYSHFGEQMKFALERSYVPTLTRYSILEDKHCLMEDIILVEGIAFDAESNDKFVAPCCIPKYCRTIIFAEYNDKNQVFVTAPSRILLIVKRDVSEFDTIISHGHTFKIVPCIPVADLHLHQDYRHMSLDELRSYANHVTVDVGSQIVRMSMPLTEQKQISEVDTLSHQLSKLSLTSNIHYL